MPVIKNQSHTASYSGLFHLDQHVYKNLLTGHMDDGEITYVFAFLCLLRLFCLSICVPVCVCTCAALCDSAVLRGLLPVGGRAPMGGVDVDPPAAGGTGAGAELLVVPGRRGPPAMSPGFHTSAAFGHLQEVCVCVCLCDQVEQQK